jgi:6-phosphogluconolactonase (cycloisomerase 2 family)
MLSYAYQHPSGPSKARVGLTCLLAFATISTATFAKTAFAQDYVGAVYTGTNDAQKNGLVAYGRKQDGTLAYIGSYASGGIGARLNSGAPIDPLVSAHSVLNIDNQYVLQVNAGSNTISSFRVNKNLSLTLVDSIPSDGFGPDTMLERDGIVYVANVDSDGKYTGPADQVGNIVAFAMNRQTGHLKEVPRSKRQLVGRPSDLAMSTNGRTLVVSIYNAGSTAISNAAADDELESFPVLAPGFLSPLPISAITSTRRNNDDGRNLPGAIGVVIRPLHGHDVVVVTESREFLSDGEAAAIPQFQTGSVSTFDLNVFGLLKSVSLDVPTSSQIASGPTNTSTSSCWLAFDKTGNTFWVVSASSSIISSFHLDENGKVEEANSRAATGQPVDPNAANPLAGATGFVDIAGSNDGFLYELESGLGTVNVYQIVSAATPLTLVQQISTGLSQTGGVMGLAYIQSTQNRGRYY